MYENMKNQIVQLATRLLTTSEKNKHCFVYKCFLDVLNISTSRYIFSNFRSSSYALEIEIGRYNNIVCVDYMIKMLLRMN